MFYSKTNEKSYRPHSDLGAGGRTFESCRPDLKEGPQFSRELRAFFVLPLTEQYSECEQVIEVNLPSSSEIYIIATSRSLATSLRSQGQH